MWHGSRRPGVSSTKRKPTRAPSQVCSSCWRACALGVNLRRLCRPVGLRTVASPPSTPCRYSPNSLAPPLFHGGDPVPGGIVYEEEVYGYDDPPTDGVFYAEEAYEEGTIPPSQIDYGSSVSLETSMPEFGVSITVESAEGSPWASATAS